MVAAIVGMFMKESAISKAPLGQLWRMSRMGLAALMLSACAANPTPEGDVYDPLEPVNRVIFRFNEGVDTVLLRPVARGYTYIVPKYGRQRVSNVLSNLRMPVVFVNSVFQLDPQNSFSALWSFLLNSTVGVFGIFDVTGATDLVVRDEDFDQSLGHYGWGAGPYLALPILGPSSTRGAAGTLVDWFTDPFNYLDNDIVIPRTIASAIDTRANVLPTTDEIYRTSIDPYATIRSGYLQRRVALVENRAGRINGGARTTGPINLKTSGTSETNGEAKE